MTNGERDTTGGRWDERHVELFIGNLLRGGVIVAAIVGALGGAIFLARHGAMVADYRVFAGQPPMLTSVQGIVRGVFAHDSRALIQLGLILLVATPIARVALSLFAFERQHDRTYMLVTSIVLILLVSGLIWGR